MECSEVGTPRRRLRRLAPVLVLFAASALVFATGGHRLINIEALIAHRAQLETMVAAHPIAAGFGFVAIYIAVVALSLPGGAAMTLLGGFLFGAVVGTGASLAGATIGAMLVFAIARCSFGDCLTRRAGPLVGRLSDGLQRDGFSYLLFLRLVPVFPFWLVNLAPALLGVRGTIFLAATAIGILPGTAVFSTVGAGLGGVLDAREAALRACRTTAASCPADLSLADFLTPQLLFGLTALGLLALTPIVARRLRRPASPVEPA